MNRLRDYISPRNVHKQLTFFSIPFRKELVVHVRDKEDEGGRKRTCKMWSYLEVKGVDRP